MYKWWRMFESASSAFFYYWIQNPQAKYWFSANNRYKIANRHLIIRLHRSCQTSVTTNSFGIKYLTSFGAGKAGYLYSQYLFSNFTRILVLLILCLKRVLTAFRSKVVTKLNTIRGRYLTAKITATFLSKIVWYTKAEACTAGRFGKCSINRKR